MSVKQTLLEMVQDILSSLDSDNVNDVNGTVESVQVATLLKNGYYDMATELGLQEHEGIVHLNASGDNTLPVLMTVPENVATLFYVEYDYQGTLADVSTHPLYNRLHYLSFKDFIIQQQALREDPSSIADISITDNLTGQTFKYTYRTNKMPQYYTTVNNTQVYFDSYDSTLDATLQASKTLCGARVYPLFDATNNNFIPVLDPTQFSYFRNKMKVRAFAELKQTSNQEAASETRAQKIIIQRNRERVDNTPAVFKPLSRFGRK